VVGSVLVDAVRTSLVDGKATDKTVDAVRSIVADLASGVKRARS
jgi:tryptophan synthase alpha chain